MALKQPHYFDLSNLMISPNQLILGRRHGQGWTKYDGWESLFLQNNMIHMLNTQDGGSSRLASLRIQPLRPIGIGLGQYPEPCQSPIFKMNFSYTTLRGRLQLVTYLNKVYDWFEERCKSSTSYFHNWTKSVDTMWSTPWEYVLMEKGL